jgi:hypothetical protein
MTEPRQPQPDEDAKWETAIVASIAIVIAILGFFALMILIGKLFPW